MAQEPEGQAPPTEPPARPLLYYFEHGTLRESAFNYDQDMQALIANPRNAGQPISRIYAKAALRSVGVPGFDVENMMDDAGPYMRQISFETIRRGGYTIHVMGMPAPENPPEAYFIGIVYKDGEPLVEGQPAPTTRYYTFEQTDVDNHVFAFGEWGADGEHETHGFGDREPTVGEFLGTVYARLGIVTPGVSINDLTLMRWLNRYGEAWARKDPALAAELFSKSASYQETPFEEAMVGQDAIREYWAEVTADQDNIDFSAEILSISGMTGVVGWSAQFRSISADAPIQMNGVFVLEFEDDETVSSLREWWHIL
jgi:hypothetical protein